MSDDLSQKPIQPSDKKDNPDSQGNQSQREIERAKPNAESRPPAPLPHSINNPADSKNEANPSIPHPPNWCEKWTLWLEVAGVLGLAFYCWVNWREWQTFDSERKTMEAELKSSQAAAEKQLVEMQADRIVSERAWINPFEITRGSDDNFSNSFYFLIRFKNIGRTPAIHSFGAIVVWTNFNPIFIPNPISITPTNISTGVVFPDVESGVQSPTMRVSILYDALVNKHPLWIYGIQQYEDIFGKRHWVRYCWVADVNSNVHYPAESGNDCDTNN